MATFHFHNLQPFRGGSARIKKPRELADFSFDDSHVCHPLSNLSMRYYYPPFFEPPAETENPPIDLSEGYRQFIERDDSVDLHLDALLDTLQLLEEQQQSTVGADFVMWRGLLTCILTAPFDDQGEFDLNATLFKGTIFIEEDHVAKAARRNEETSRRRTQRQGPPQELMQYWGYKFETLCTISSQLHNVTRDEIDDRGSMVVNNNAQYCSIVQTGIDGNVILLGGEVDAVENSGKPEDPEEQIPYIELKTSQDFYAGDERAARRFEKKLCRFWAQSFLLGVPKIIIGFRDPDGFLHRLETLKTMEIPNHVKHKGFASWDGNICINFAAAYLQFLKQHITTACTWKIQRKRGEKRITLMPSNDIGSGNFLTARYKSHRDQSPLTDTDVQTQDIT